jgi:hypothetical protein
MRRLELYSIALTEQDAIDWCRDKGLLARAMDCPECGDCMTEVIGKGEQRATWRCTRTVNGVRHFRFVSIRDGSIFEHTRTSIRIGLFLLYEWSINANVNQTAYEMDLDKKTVFKAFGIFRNLAGLAIDRVWANKLGHNGETIEIDECQIGRRKHHRGRLGKELWVFGAISREVARSELFFEPVRKRNAKTLMPIIKDHIDTRARIISDDWGAYRKLSEHGFRHDIVKHCDNFVDPDDKTKHTQNIENTWKLLRSFINKKGTYSRKYIIDYIKEFVYRKRCVDVFECMLSDIPRYFCK